MRLDAFKITQFGHQEEVELYTSVIQTKDLIKRYRVDRWTPKNTGGYQRLITENRLKDRRGSILRFLVKEMGCFPTSVLVNIRGEVSFEEERDYGWCKLGKLDTFDEPFWLIDGQHRVEALKKAIDRKIDYEDYPLVVSILKLPERFEEMLLFYFVNRRQRGVKTDLAYRHIQRMLWDKGVDWLKELEGERGKRIAIAIDLVDQLNREPASPWYNRVRLVTEPSRESHLIKDQTIASSIIPILTEAVLKGIPSRKLGEHLIEYWNALFIIYPDIWENPGEYTLLDRQGVHSMHLLFPHIYSRCLEKERVTQENLILQLTKLLTDTPDHPHIDFRDPLTSDFWSRSHGPLVSNTTNMAARRELADNMLTKIQIAEGS